MPEKEKIGASSVDNSLSTLDLIPSGPAALEILRAYQYLSYFFYLLGKYPPFFL